MLFRTPHLVIARFLEVGFGVLWQIIAPRGFERHACGFETYRGAMAVVARMTTWIETAGPLPPICRRRGTPDRSAIAPTRTPAKWMCQLSGRSLTRLRVRVGMRP